jgi:hypothetical protein
LRKIDLIRRTSYRNHAKGLRRLEALLAGDLDGAPELLRSFPHALDVHNDEFHRVVQETRDALELERREAAAMAEAEWRAAFVPHAVILPERDIPQPIFVAAFLGAKRLLQIEFENKDPSTFLDQALEQAKERPGMFWDSTEVLPAFGKVVGVVINHTPNAPSITISRATSWPPAPVRTGLEKQRSGSENAPCRPSYLRVAKGLHKRILWSRRPFIRSPNF